jgi:hypothetical protein
MQMMITDPVIIKIPREIVFQRPDPDQTHTILQKPNLLTSTHTRIRRHLIRQYQTKIEHSIMSATLPPVIAIEDKICSRHWSNSSTSCAS